MNPLRWTFLGLAAILTACGSPPTEPTPDESIPAGRRQLVTEVSATIAGYTAGETNATLAWAPQLDLDLIPWRPFALPTAISSAGQFTVTLPNPAPAVTGPTQIINACGATLEITSVGVLFTHDGNSEDATIDLTSPSYSRRIFDGDGELFGIEAPGLTVVFFWYMDAPFQATCQDTLGDGGIATDLDLDLVAGWNPVTAYTREVDGETIIHFRSGEPNFNVEWRQVGVD